MPIDVRGHSHTIHSIELLDLVIRKAGPGQTPGLEGGVAFVMEHGTAGKFTLTSSLVSERSVMLLEQLLESLERDAASQIFPGASTPAATREVESF